MKLVVVALAAFLLPFAAGAEPNYRAMAAEAISSQLLDPFSVKKAMATPALKYPSGAIAMCVTFYAKNRSGAYGGKLVWSVVFTKDGSRLKFAHDVTGMGSSCENETGYTPFKELENF